MSQNISQNSRQSHLRLKAYGVLVLGLLLLLTSCSFLRSHPEGTRCKIRTYTDAHLQDYITSRFYSGLPARTAIIPFSVQETFAPFGNNSLHYGRDLALALHRELFASGKLPIIEVFYQEGWPGKRAQFFQGNYKALQLAGDAGYDLVIDGVMQPIQGSDGIVVYTKVIDTSNAQTIWSGETTITTDTDKIVDRIMSNPPYQQQKSFFDYKAGADEYASCTTERMFFED